MDGVFSGLLKGCMDEFLFVFMQNNKCKKYLIPKDSLSFENTFFLLKPIGPDKYHCIVIIVLT